ncbi:MAG: PEP-CTERM sorting domain-containing protein [Schlesneria sp.]
MTRSFLSSIISCITLSVALFDAPSLNASLMIYNDYSSWSSHVTGVSTEDITNPTGNSTYQYFGKGTQSVSFGNATFSQSGTLGNGFFYVIGTGYSAGLPTAPVISSQRETTGVANIQITFDFAVSGFALNFGTRNGSDVSFQLFNNSTIVDTFTKASTGGNAYNTTNFVGATDTPFTSVLIKTTDQFLNINNVADSSPSNSDSAVPEPSTFFLLGLGGIGLFVRALRRKKPASN